MRSERELTEFLLINLNFELLYKIAIRVVPRGLFFWVRLWRILCSRISSGFKEFLHQILDKVAPPTGQLGHM